MEANAEKQRLAEDAAREKVGADDMPTAQAGSAQFNSPLGIAVATNGDVFIADSGNHCIRRISGGVVSTCAGSPPIWGSADGAGTNAQFNGPVGLAFDARGNLFVSDANNDTIRKITTNGVVTTLAGALNQAFGRTMSLRQYQ